MTASGSYVFDQQHRDARKEVERLAAQARLGWSKEARTLTWFGMQDGMALLELGSGPGFITAQLLQLLPTSSITCLEIDPILIEQARQYLPPDATQRVHFVQGSVMDMKLPEDHFDFAYGRLLFQHLPDPIGAVKETWRVLKPGGKFVIYDIDDGMYGLIEPQLPELAFILEKYSQAQAARGGNRHIGRSLWRILSAAGFINLDLEVITSHSDDVGIQPFLPQIDPDRMLPLLKVGLITAEQLEAIRASVANFLASPEPYILEAAMMVCGEKLA